MVYLLALALILKKFPVERGKPESCHHIAGRFYADPDAIYYLAAAAARGASSAVMFYQMLLPSDSGCPLLLALVTPDDPYLSAHRP